jgi:hypothetical protein
MKNHTLTNRPESIMKRFLLTTLLAVTYSLPTASAQDEPIAEAAPATRPGATSSPSPAPKVNPSVAARPITVSINLVDDVTLLTGTLTETNTLSIKTAFGAAELPLSEVAGIKFPRGEDSSTTVVMLNGDSITGATDLKFATIETSWGSAKINGQSISSMLFVPGLSWQATDIMSSKRWQLIETPRNPQTAGNAPGGSRPGQPGQSVQPGTNRPGQPVQPSTGQPPRTTGGTTSVPSSSSGAPVRINN